MSETKILMRDSQLAFKHAIENGTLNLDESSPRYAGKWMYMHTENNGSDAFKNIRDRNYIRSVNTVSGTFTF